MLALFALPALLGLGLIFNIIDDDSQEDRPEDPPEPPDTLFVPDDVESFRGSDGDDIIVARDDGGFIACLLLTSDAADGLLCVGLGGCRIIKTKTS